MKKIKNKKKILYLLCGFRRVSLSDSLSLMASIKFFRAKLLEASLLWLLGFREACRLHRVLILCLRSRKLLIRTGQCFLLNGFLFLGSILILNSVIIPTLQWILPDHCSKLNSQSFCSIGGLLRFYSFLRLTLIQLFYVTWFYPLYVFSIILSTMWYNDIGKYGFVATGSSGPAKLDFLKQNEDRTERPVGLGGVMIGIGEQLYSLLLLGFFFLEVYVTGFVPYIGKTVNFLLLSWMYAYYCFEYKWNLSEVGLDRRLDFFESNWAFFAGFGSPCVLPVLFSSPLVSYGIMAILYPLFVLTATDSGAEQVISSQRRKWGGAGLGRLPIFHLSDILSLKVLSLVPLAPPQEKLQDSKTL